MSETASPNLKIFRFTLYRREVFYLFKAGIVVRVIATFQFRAALRARKPQLGQSDDLVGALVQLFTPVTEAGIRTDLMGEL